MLAELADRSDLVRATFAEASVGANIDLWAIASAADDPRLNQTEFTQPVLLAAAIAVWRVWLAHGGVIPVRLAGHSLGEYAALVAGGALSLADGARLVRQRGCLMQAAVPVGAGAMAAVLGAEDALIAEVCAAVSGDEVVVPANFNSPGQIVIGGDVAAVDRALAELAARGVRKVIKLPVSVPSHTPLMRAAAAQLGEALAAVSWSLPSIPVIQNVDAAAYGSTNEILAALQRQLYLPVRWTDCVKSLTASGCSRIAECGPGRVLSGLCKRIDKTLDVRALGMPVDLDSALNEWSAA